MYDAIWSMVTPVLLMDALTLASRLRLSIDASRGGSFAFVGVEPGVALDAFFGLLFGVAGRIGTFGAFPGLSSGDGISASSAVE